MQIDPPRCPMDCGCERFPIYRVVEDKKGNPRPEVIATGVECKLMSEPQYAELSGAA